MFAVKVQSLFNIGTGQENGKQFIFSNAYERYAFARTLLGGSVPDLSDYDGKSIHDGEVLH